MQHLKIIGLAAILAAAFMALAGSASATPILTSPAGTEYTGTFEASLEKGTSALFKTTVANVTCTGSTIAADVTTNNETHASGPITTLDFSGCSTTFDPLKNADGTFGSLTINDKGEVFGFNIRITKVASGVHCVFGAASSGTKLGTLTGGTPAKLVISATVPLLEGSAFLFGSTGTWTASYTVTKPGTLLIT